MLQFKSITNCYNTCFVLVVLIFTFMTSNAQVLPDLRVASIFLEDENTYKPPASDSRVRAQVLIENLSAVDIIGPIQVSATASLAASTALMRPSPTVMTRTPIATTRQRMGMTKQPIVVGSVHLSSSLAKLHPVILSRQSASYSISGGKTLTVLGTLTAGIQAYKTKYIDLIFPVDFPYTHATVQCTVDVNSSIAESDENNNMRKENFIVERRLVDMTYSTRIDSISNLVDIYVNSNPKVASFIVYYTNTSNRNITPYNSRGDCYIGDNMFYHHRIIRTDSDIGWYDIVPPNGHFAIEYSSIFDRLGTRAFSAGQLSVSCDNKLMNWCRQGNCYDVWFQETVTHSITNSYVPSQPSTSVDLTLHEIFPSGTMGSISPPEASGNTWIRVGVRNIGGPIPTTPAFVVTCKLLKNGNVVSTLSIPGVGGSEFDYHWFNFGRQFAGSYSVECEVDPNNTMPDTNWSNNTMSTMLTVVNN